ncbi:MAG: putative toxin-antitoxin system toxin component, PIN family [Deltaproteobacteria bacterium]|nr:MAG: putative toxin-antitoxin system toxin component, PIN family [Deltaproteobacteria bacterium]
MKVVLDTNVLVSGLMLPDSVPGQIVAAWRGAHFDLALSEPMLEEIGRVLSYPKIQGRLRWGPDDIARFLLLLRFKADVVDISKEKADVPRDPGDDPVLATLLASGADCLVSGDSDLLALRDRFPIQTPAGFARRLK